MRKKSTESGEESRTEWETLEAFARQGMQRLLQRVLEEEVDELLGRGRYERRAAVDAPGGYRNGFGQPRRLSLSNGTITLRRPRVRGLEERFESRLLPAFKRRTEEVGRLLPPKLVIGDGHLGIWGALAAVFPEAAEQRCWNHRLLNILDKLPRQRTGRHSLSPSGTPPPTRMSTSPA